MSGSPLTKEIWLRGHSIKGLLTRGLWIRAHSMKGVRGTEIRGTEIRGTEIRGTEIRELTTGIWVTRVRRAMS
jgi:hypothetical protein